MPATPLDNAALAQILTEARTRNGWTDTPVPEALLHRLYDLTKFGPTSANMSPARFVFVTSEEGKARLLPLMSEGNREKTRQAPVAVIIAHEVEFRPFMKKLFPHADAASWFPTEEGRREAAFRNGTLQAGYMILAARALGLDCGPMSGFDMAGVKKEFFDGTTIEPNFVLNLGYGSDENLFPRSPRLNFDEAAQII